MLPVFKVLVLRALDVDGLPAEGHGLFRGEERMRREQGHHKDRGNRAQ